MLPVELARTPKESRIKRAAHLAEARYWKVCGNRRMKQLALQLARNERMNNFYFLGDAPF
ncbi:hypothetical protein [Raoultella terrigena]|uniref:hypothetical protein n=1 Tax=Raoultella terrigena TaxID=577 RepID=UPI0030DED02B